MYTGLWVGDLGAGDSDTRWPRGHPSSFAFLHIFPILINSCLKHDLSPALDEAGQEKTMWLLMLLAPPTVTTLGSLGSQTWMSGSESLSEVGLRT